jgi:tocopherol O-methyltransferase
MTSGSGVSLSPFQVQKANEFTATVGLSDKLKYQVADALEMPFANNKFDLSKFMI